jgi:hypothetical protein
MWRNHYMQQNAHVKRDIAALGCMAALCQTGTLYNPRVALT